MEKTWELPAANGRLIFDSERGKMIRTKVLTREPQTITTLRLSRKGLVTQGQANKARDGITGVFGLRLTVTERKLDIVVRASVLNEQHGLEIVDIVVEEINRVIIAEQQRLAELSRPVTVSAAAPKPRYVNRSRR